MTPIPQLRLEDLDDVERAQLGRLAVRAGKTPAALLEQLLVDPVLSTNEASLVVQSRMEDLDEQLPPGPCSRCGALLAPPPDLLCPLCRAAQERGRREGAIATA